MAEPQTTIRQNLLHRFYGLILLLETLGAVRGDRVKADMISDHPSTHDTKLRRHFCNALAYICAFDTGSDNVTAIAIDAQPDRRTVLIAANKGVRPEVVEFLQCILYTLQRVAAGLIQPDSTLLDAMVRVVVESSQPRIRHYHKEAVELCQPCLPIIQTASRRYARTSASYAKALELANLEKFLDYHFSLDQPLKTLEDCLALVKNCHDIRSSSGIIDSLTPFAAHGQSCQSLFQRLQEVIKKLGKHITCTRRLLEAAAQLPDEFIFGFDVKPISSSAPGRINLPLNKASVESIICRLTASKSEQEDIKKQLEQRRSLDEMSDEIRQKRKKTITQTHAELLLIDYIDRYGCVFPDPNDRYIGCSKPACYLCHLYIHHHPRGYSLPDKSNKLYIKWRMPGSYFDADTDTREQVGKAEKILDAMIQEIKRDFKNDLARSKARFMHADSSADMTSTVVEPVDLTAETAAGAGAQTGSINSYLESLSLNDHTLVQVGKKEEERSPPAFNYYNPPPYPHPQLSPQIHQHPPVYLPLQPQTQTRIQIPPYGSSHPPDYLYPHQTLGPLLPVFIPSPSPEMISSNSASASTSSFSSYSSTSPPPLQSSGRTNASRSPRNSKTKDTPNFNNNNTSNKGSQQQAPQSQSQTAKRAGWKGPPNQRWVRHGSDGV
ncbi:hypothetical protein AJ79_01488 [Helicocarpus griseus UAMH5409]|uniref:Uncharacterized protein n=1 Tax=Helicocarpus griseus UAMH5409 TaxID=1447875 RepID=A0A2B7XYH0_9EURO|nr:hypothetical protein AJ79_01488 [Helicocarpus griseus UAMH5409]